MTVLFMNKHIQLYEIKNVSLVIIFLGERCVHCPVNEEYSKKPICPPDTCSAIGKEYDCCNAKSPPFKTGCRCKSGYYRLNENGPCVLACDCPPPPDCCSENEVYSSEPICPPDICSSISAGYCCDCPELPPYKPGCKCKGGYLRLEKNSPCVSACNCPQNSNYCPENEVCVLAPFCPPDTCFSRSARYDCRNVTANDIGCRCKDGYLRLTENSPCIPIDQC